MPKKKTPAERAAERRRALYMRFAAIYVANGRNATQAYLAIHPNVTAGSAGTRGGTMLTNVEVQNEIARLTAEAWKKEHMTAEEVLGRMARVARQDIRDYYWRPGERARDGSETVEGHRKPLSELTDAQAECVKGFRYDSDGRLIQDLYAKDAQWANIAKHLKLLNDKLEVSGADGGPIELRWAGDTNAET